MFRAASQKCMPALRPLCRSPVHRAASCRSFWDLRPTTNVVRSLFREIERLERDLFERFPLRNIAPRFIPVEGSEAAAYRVNVDVRGFKPEEINVALKDKVLSIRAKMERNSEDGGKFSQEVYQVITLPENVKTAEVKSFLNSDGVLSVEVPFEPAENPTEIPVSK